MVDKVLDSSNWDDYQCILGPNYTSYTSIQVIMSIQLQLDTSETVYSMDNMINKIQVQEMNNSNLGIRDGLVLR